MYGFGFEVFIESSSSSAPSERTLFTKAEADDTALFAAANKRPRTCQPVLVVAEEEEEEAVVVLFGEKVEGEEVPDEVFELTRLLVGLLDLELLEFEEALTV